MQIIKQHFKILDIFLSGSYVPHDISFFLQHNKIDNKQAIHRIIIEDSLQQAEGNVLAVVVQSLFGKEYPYEKTFV